MQSSRIYVFLEGRKLSRKKSISFGQELNRYLRVHWLYVGESGSNKKALKKENQKGLSHLFREKVERFKFMQKYKNEFNLERMAKIIPDFGLNN
ncbi:hypothetical protein H1Q59_02455 [Holosporaceae bacterium 'Namur']|nr:hypothetical protein [Holosporaceae bacterium 'Namur']